MVTLFTLLILIATSVIAQDCVNDSTNPQCRKFVYPGAKDDIKAMCSGSMANMPGCTLQTLCQDDTSLASSPYCNNLSILRTLCNDMSMTPCKNMKKMCGNGTVVEECLLDILPLPSSLQAANGITSICDSMQMAGCSKCDAKMTCDLLTVYSDLCLSMPSMTGCEPWKNFCNLIPDWPLCSTESPSAPPEMQMFFHTGVSDYILFKSWVPRTTAQYAGSWFAIFLVSALYEGLKVARWLHELPIIRGDAQKVSLSGKSGVSWIFLAKRIFASEIVQALLRSIENGVSLLIMLVAMTFNVGLFFAIIAGTFCGWLIFGRYRYDHPDVQTAVTELPGSTCC